METQRFDYDAVIVGSGFGGSVMAYRLAAAGLRVCVMERGKAYPPGSFPRSPMRMQTNFWDPSEGLHGLFNIWSFNGLSAVVSSGLGGGSLIYANVLLRKEKETFEEEGWPISLKDLEPHYENAERMLSAQPYPFEPEPDPNTPSTPDREAYNQTAKSKAMWLAAKRLKAEGKDVTWLLPNLAVTFANPCEQPVPGQPIHGTGRAEPDTTWNPDSGPIPSLFGRTRLTCVMCGQCDVGCNIGAKNTLDHTYLSAAILQPGATTIMPRTEVKEMEPRDGGYAIRYVDHNPAVELKKRETKPELHTVTSRYLILSAGALGSTFLLLKNEKRFPRIAREALGTRFCGNGDLLTFIQKCVDDEATPREPRVLDAGYGPVITSALRFKDRQNGQSHGHYFIEDAGYPEAINWILELATPFAVLKRSVRFGWRVARGWLRFEPDSDIGAEFSSFLGKTVLSSTSMPLLAMGRDNPDGKMRLTKDGLLDIDWKLSGSSGYFRRVRSSSKDIARVLGGRFRDNPLTLLSRVITVHPLGGCPMDGADWPGVVDSYGRVHGYEGFIIADGSVVPGPVGPNPSLTIAALADRFADRLIADHRATVAEAARNQATILPGSPPAAADQPATPVSP